MVTMDDDTNANYSDIGDWQALVNKPVIASDGQEVGIVRSIQPERLMVDYGPITPDHYLIPKSSVKNFENGVIHLKNDSKFVEAQYKFE
jgi:hypothetical protein